MERFVVKSYRNEEKSTKYLRWPLEPFFVTVGRESVGLWHVEPSFTHGLTVKYYGVHVQVRG